jgi:hypothetical protein
MLRFFSLLVTVLLLWCSVTAHAAKAAKAPASAAIPRGKSKGNTGGYMGQGLVQRLFREAKVSFCSELEALTLQLTRPNAAAISMSSMEDIINFVNLEYDNPQLMISLLVKFSRKFAESNVYTKLKAILALHKLMENVKDKAQTGLLKSVRSLRAEADEKTGALFFAPGSIEEAAGRAGNVAEIQAVELARVYSAYVFDFIDTKGTSSLLAEGAGKKKGVKGVVVSDAAARTSQLLGLLEQGDEVEECCVRTKSPLGTQCLDAVIEDRTWVDTELTKLYHDLVSIDDEEEEELRGEAEVALKKLDSKFKPKAHTPKKPMHTPTPTAAPVKVQAKAHKAHTATATQTPVQAKAKATSTHSTSTPSTTSTSTSTDTYSTGSSAPSTTTPSSASLSSRISDATPASKETATPSAPTAPTAPAARTVPSTPSTSTASTTSTAPTAPTATSAAKSSKKKSKASASTSGAKKSSKKSK